MVRSRVLLSAVVAAFCSFRAQRVLPRPYMLTFIGGEGRHPLWHRPLDSSGVLVSKRMGEWADVASLPRGALAEPL